MARLTARSAATDVPAAEALGLRVAQALQQGGAH